MPDFVNSLDPFTQLMELERNRISGELELVPANGMQELVDVLNNLGAAINNTGLTQEQLAASVLGLLGVQPVTGYATLNGYPTQNGGNSYAPLCFGAMPARYEEATLTSEVWTVGTEVPGGESKTAQYVSVAGDSPGGSTYDFVPEIAVRIPPNFKGWEGNAIVFKYTIEDVSGYATNDTITAGLQVEATIPGFSAVTKTRVETLTAPGPYGDGGVYSTLTVTADDLGSGWTEGALLRVKPYFSLTCASGGVTVDLRWSDLRVNWR